MTEDRLNDPDLEQRNLLDAVLRQAVETSSGARSGDLNTLSSRSGHW